jgi:hypothetical protein
MATTLRKLTPGKAKAQAKIAEVTKREKAEAVKASHSETLRARRNAALQIYLELGPSRTLAKAATAVTEKIGKTSVASIAQWSSAESWSDKAREYDAAKTLSILERAKSVLDVRTMKPEDVLLIVGNMSLQALVDQLSGIRITSAQEARAMSQVAETVIKLRELIINPESASARRETLNIQNNITINDAQHAGTARAHLNALEEKLRAVPRLTSPVVDAVCEDVPSDAPLTPAAVEASPVEAEQRAAERKDVSAKSVGGLKDEPISRDPRSVNSFAELLRQKLGG